MNSLPKTVTRQRRDCDLNTDTSGKIVEINALSVLADVTA